jgi:hypothetical protein
LPREKTFHSMDCVRLVFGGFRLSHHVQQPFDFLRHHSQLRASNSLRSRFVQCLKDSRRGERRSGLRRCNFGIQKNHISRSTRRVCKCLSCGSLLSVFCLERNFSQRKHLQ